MTEKQTNIIQAALELFAKEGYHATSTNKVAKKAGVSEGLVFRHFENKAGLLEAILKEGEKRFKALYADIVFEQDPKLVIQRVIDLPFSINDEEKEFWKLQYKLKWELNQGEDQKLKPLQLTLATAFKKLEYKNPDMEALTLIHLLDGIGGAILKGSLENFESYRDFLAQKYNL